MTTSPPTIWKLPPELSSTFTKRFSFSKAIPAWAIGTKPNNRVRFAFLLYEHYRITYLVKPDGDIDILGVFHGALDIDRYFV